MTRVLMLVEGQSEEIFVKTTLGPYLEEKYCVYVSPIVLWTKRLAVGGGFRGGVSGWEQIRKNLLPLTFDTHAWITTLLDFYGLPDDFPGIDQASVPAFLCLARKTKISSASSINLESTKYSRYSEPNNRV